MLATSVNFLSTYKNDKKKKIKKKDQQRSPTYTVEPRYVELAYFELPLISKWKSDPCFNMQLWQQVTK